MVELEGALSLRVELLGQCRLPLRLPHHRVADREGDHRALPEIRRVELVQTVDESAAAGQSPCWAVIMADAAVGIRYCGGCNPAV